MQTLISRITVLLAITGALWWVAQSPFVVRLLEGDSSTTERYEMAQIGLKLFYDNPIFGIGYDQYQYISRDFGLKNTYSHSSLIETLACTGLVGSVLYFGSLFLIFRQFLRVYRNATVQEEGQMLGCFLALVVLIVFFNIFAVISVSKYIWPILGIMAGYARSVQLKEGLDSIPQQVRPYHRVQIKTVT